MAKRIFLSLFLFSVSCFFSFSESLRYISPERPEYDCFVFDWFELEDDESITMKKLRDQNNDGEVELFVFTNCEQYGKVEMDSSNDILKAKVKIASYCKGDLFSVYQCPLSTWVQIKEDLEKYGSCCECIIPNGRIFDRDEYPSDY